MGANEMRASEVSVEWLKKIDFNLKHLSAIPPTIEGVIIKELTVHLDGRGDVTELWSKPWVREGLSEVQHIYQSATDFGVVKCWHLHEEHTDQFTVTRGKLQVTLVDVREGSKTFGHVNTIFLGSLKPRLIKIPPMVLHGWKALSYPEVIVVNVQSHVYAPGDEFKFPWDCIIPDIWQPKNG